MAELISLLSGSQIPVAAPPLGLSQRLASLQLDRELLHQLAPISGGSIFPSYRNSHLVSPALHRRARNNQHSFREVAEWVGAPAPTTALDTAALDQAHTGWRDPLSVTSLPKQGSRYLGLRQAWTPGNERFYLVSK